MLEPYDGKLSRTVLRREGGGNTADPADCTVRIVAATYSEDESEGAMCVLNLLTRIRVALLKDGVVGGQFVLKSPLEMIVYPDSTAPYYLGEMMTKWTMPIIESEVQQIWQ